jgi:hypothetical protein
MNKIDCPEMLMWPQSSQFVGTYSRPFGSFGVRKAVAAAMAAPVSHTSRLPKRLSKICASTLPMPGTSSKACLRNCRLSLGSDVGRTKMNQWNQGIVKL